tara:strand:- start:355 stop:1764 length:1410 start_codon:yes stop_codon:yes gene_type:complete
VFNGGFAAGGVGSFADGSVSAPSITNTGDTHTGMFFPGNDEIAFGLGGAEATRIAGGRVLIGAEATVATIGANPSLQVHGTTYDKSHIAVYRYTNDDAVPSHITLSRSRGTSVGSHTVIQANDIIGRIEFAGSDGTDFESLGNITMAVDTTPGNNDMPGRMMFSTTSNGAASSTERMRIDSAGQVYTTTGITGANSDMATGYVSGTGSIYSRGFITSGARSNNTGYLAGLAIVNGDNAQNGGSGSTARLVANIGGEVVTNDSNAQDDSGGDMTFWTKPDGGSIAERMRVLSGGDVKLVTGNLVIGAEGKGIDFSNQAGTATDTVSELLDHYEEGTCTLEITADGGTDFTTATNNRTETSYYTRVGNTVMIIAAAVGGGAMSGGNGNVLITGLPFASSDTAGKGIGVGAVQFGRFGAVGGNDIIAINSQNATTFRFKINNNDANPTVIAASDLNGNSSPFFSTTLVYKVD